MIFERHRIIQPRFLHDLDLLHSEFISAGDAGCALIFADSAGDDDRRLLRQAHDPVKYFGFKVAFEGHALNKARAVAHKQEDQLALIGAIIDPAFDGHFLPNVI